RKAGRGCLRAAPPQACFGWGLAAFDPDARKHRIEATATATNAEIEHLHVRGGEDGVGAPAGDAVFALGVAVYEVVVLIGSGDVPHSPFALMVNEVRFVNAPV